MKEVVNDLFFYYLYFKFLFFCESDLNCYIHYLKAQTFLSKRIRTYK